jgi:hypothetical protein
LSAISKPSTDFFANHNDSWLLKTLLGEENYSSSLKLTPIRLESAQLSRAIGTKTLTQNYCDAQPLSKLWRGDAQSIFSDILSGAANGQHWIGVAIYSRRLLLLVSCVGIFPEEERRCSTVEISISLNENQAINPVGESCKAS